MGPKSTCDSNEWTWEGASEAPSRQRGQSAPSVRACARAHTHTDTHTHTLTPFCCVLSSLWVPRRPGYTSLCIPSSNLRGRTGLCVGQAPGPGVEWPRSLQPAPFAKGELQGGTVGTLGPCRLPLGHAGGLLREQARPPAELGEGGPCCLPGAGGPSGGPDPPLLFGPTIWQERLTHE